MKKILTPLEEAIRRGKERIAAVDAAAAVGEKPPPLPPTGSERWKHYHRDPKEVAAARELEARRYPD